MHSYTKIKNFSGEVNWVLLALKTLSILSSVMTFVYHISPFVYIIKINIHMFDIK